MSAPSGTAGGLATPSLHRRRPVTPSGARRRRDSRRVGQAAPEWLEDVDTSTPAVVLKTDPNAMHHGALGVVRSLGRLGVPVYAVQEGRFSPAGHSRYLAGTWRWRPVVEDEERMLEGLRHLAQVIGRSVLITTDDAGAIFVAEHAEELREDFAFAEPPSWLPRALADKTSLHALCEQLGLPSPAQVRAETDEQAQAFAAEHGFPIVAKLTAPWVDTRGGRFLSTVILHSRDELDALLRRGAGTSTGYLLQQYIAGGPGADWFLHGYSDRDADLRPGFTGVKLRSYPSQAGLTSFGVARRNEELRSLISGFVKRLGYRGILDCDVRFDERDGTYKLLDFNPRLGAQFRLFRNDAHVDVAVAAYLDLTGGVVPGAQQVDGRSFVVEPYDALSAVASMRRGELGLRSWLGSLRSVDETAWFARDDLKPFGLMCVRTGWRMATRPIERWRREGAGGSRSAVHHPQGVNRGPSTVPAGVPDLALVTPEILGARSASA